MGSLHRNLLAAVVLDILLHQGFQYMGLQIGILQIVDFHCTGRPGYLLHPDMFHISHEHNFHSLHLQYNNVRLTHIHHLYCPLRIHAHHMLHNPVNFYHIMVVFGLHCYYLYHHHIFHSTLHYPSSPYHHLRHIGPGLLFDFLALLLVSHPR
jgi:hypothetical protein